MNRTMKLIIAITIPVILIAAFFIVTTIQRNQEAAAAPEEPVSDEITLFEVDEKNVKQITVEYEGTSFSVIWAKDHWELVESIEGELKQGFIDLVGKSATNVKATRLIEEEPEDLTQYGLDEPASTFTVTLDDDSTFVGMVGAPTPSRTGFYFKRKDEASVYSVPITIGRSFLRTVDDFLNRDIATVDLENFTYLLIRGERTIEIGTKEEVEDQPLYAVSTYVMTQPYRNSRGIDLRSMETLTKSVPTKLRAVDFVEEHPIDLSKYGIDPLKPAIIIRDKEENGYHLSLGKEAGNRLVYAKVKDDPRVFTISTFLLDFLTIKPFQLISKFALILNIDDVDQVKIEFPQKSALMAIEREKTGKKNSDGEDEIKETFYLDGVVVEEDPFKVLYQKAIGILMDAENPTPDYTGNAIQGGPAMRITYILNKEPYEAVAEFHPYNKDFYALYRNGISEFLVSIEQITDIEESLEKFPDISNF